MSIQFQLQKTVILEVREPCFTAIPAETVWICGIFDTFPALRITLRSGRHYWMSVTQTRQSTPGSQAHSLVQVFYIVQDSSLC